MCSLCLRGSFNFFNELIKEELGIRWATAGFGMELGGEERLGFVPDPFIGLVIEVPEQRFPSVRQGGIIQSKSMILGSDVGLVCP